MTSPLSFTATANPNIALIKYWGKSDEKLILPVTGSLSMTLDAYPTTTTVTLDDALTADVFILNGVMQEGKNASRVQNFLDLIRQRSGRNVFARIDSVNLVPTAAGLASSASGFAALAVAASAAFGLNLSDRDLSRLARRGSGSASRSLFPGLVLWHAGNSDETSYAEAIDPGSLDLGMTVIEVSRDKKKISSRDAMRITQDTSPLFENWALQNENLLERMVEAIAAGDFETMGELSETSSYGMHATMLAATPSIWYPTAETQEVLDRVHELKDAGINCYATMDAGPNVKILSLAADRETIREAFAEMIPADRIIQAGMGLGARLTAESERL